MITAWLVLAGFVIPVAASPAPVSGCPPCDRGFIQSANQHGLDTEVRHSEATIRAHRNGSASWTVRVVPTNRTVLRRLETNGSLARSVAAGSFGVRYGDGIDHELQTVTVADGAVVIRYRTLDVVKPGPLGTRVLTYFRDDPGAYVYTDLGADRVTVVAPPEMAVARSFGTVEGDRLIATALPDGRDGPFVVFAPEGTPLPGLVGWLAILEALGGVLVRNVGFFVIVPGGVLVGGLAAIRRVLGPETRIDPARLGALVALGGAGLLVGSVLWEGDVHLAVTGSLLAGTGAGLVLLLVGTAVGVPAARRHLTGPRLLLGGVVAAVAVFVITGGHTGVGVFDTAFPLGAGLLPIVTAQGWVDASGRNGTQLFGATAVVIVAALAAAAPLTALGGSLFLLVPIMLAIAAGAVVVVAVPLYLLGVAGAAAMTA